MLKKSLFFFEEFSYITSFTADRYSQLDPLWLFELSTWVQIHKWQVEDSLQVDLQASEAGTVKRLLTPVFDQKTAF